MKKVIYESLKVSNFLSIGPSPIEIVFKKGMNLITGQNLDLPERKNGIGKSALIEAVYYSMFGTTIRKLKKEKIFNNVTKKAGSLELVFRVETESGIVRYKIIRELKPSSVKLWLLGDVVEDITKDSIANTDKYICDLIGSNPTISKSCDIISATDNIPFMSMKPEEKRKFHEDIFTLEIFGIMMKQLKENIKTSKMEFAIATSKKDEIGRTLDNLNTQFSEQKQLEMNRKEMRDKELDELDNKKTGLLVEIAELSSFIFDETEINDENEKIKNAIANVDGKIGNINVEIGSSKRSIEDINNNIDHMKNVGQGTCTQCLQVIGSSHTEHLEQSIRELNDVKDNKEVVLSGLLSEKQALFDKKTKLQDKLNKNFEKLKTNSQNKTSLSLLKANVGIFEEKIEALKNDNSSSGVLEIVEKNIQETEKRLNSVVEQWDSLKTLLDDYETCKFVIGDDGVKSMIVKQLVDMLNSSIQSYITRLGMNMRCKFDEYFEETITNDKGEDLSYWNLSGGERRTIDIACAWAFKDIKRKISGVSSNIEFIDEILDGAFDSHGVDLLIEVLKERIDKQNMSVYVISHRKETEKHIDGDTIFLVKENRVTKRIDNFSKDINI